MIKVFLKGHNFQYDVGELLKIFIQSEKIEFVDNESSQETAGFLLVNSLSSEDNQYFITAKMMKNNEIIEERNIACKIETMNQLEIRKIIKRNIKLCIFDALKVVYNQSPSWGILTGIRPTKIVHEFLDQGLSIEESGQKLKDDYRMSEEKIELVKNIAEIERPIIENNHSDCVSIYISIPFCPTRCVYCSFPSNPLDRGKNQIKEYLEALVYEIHEVGKLLNRFKKKIDTLYIGGGTPTTLSAVELEMLIKEIKEHMNLSEVREITVEAGRPDTITKEKLITLKRNGVNRISINPQTMNEDTLESIGRLHSSKEIIDTYYLAKEIGFDTINMDLIIGLPGESESMVENTMKQIEKLEPENITVHTLAVKKTSKLRENLQKYALAEEEQAKKMLAITKKYAEQMNLVPYYMYRQKYMLGNLENIGYGKIGHECIYNIQIIEEKQSIIALGAGAASKIFYKEENRLERVPNVTNVEIYIKRVAEMVDRKRKELEKLR